MDGEHVAVEQLVVGERLDADPVPRDALSVEQDAAGLQQGPQPPQGRLGVGQVLQDVAAGDAVLAAGRQGRGLAARVQDEDPVQDAGGGGGDGRLALHAIDDAGGVEPLQGGAEVAGGAADVQDVRASVGTARRRAGLQPE